MPADDELKQLQDAARDASANAYAPYSGFRVGAAVRTVDGSIFVGCNVENASYGLGLCAERAALVSAVSAGQREFSALAVHVEGDDGPPCGACRQFIAEFGPAIEVTYRYAGRSVTRPIREMLADAFVPAMLRTP